MKLLSGNQLFLDFNSAVNSSNVTNSTGLVFNINIFDTNEEVAITNSNDNQKPGNTNNNNNNIFFGIASLLAENQTGVLPPITNTNHGSGKTGAGNVNNNNNNIILGVLVPDANSNGTNATQVEINNNNDNTDDDLYSYDDYNDDYGKIGSPSFLGSMPSKNVLNKNRDIVKGNRLKSPLFVPKKKLFRHKGKILLEQDKLPMPRPARFDGILKAINPFSLFPNSRLSLNSGFMNNRRNSGLNI